MVDLNNKRNPVRIFAAHDAHYSKSGSHCIATSFYSQAYDVFRIEINRVGGEGRTGAVFNTLVHRKNITVAGVGQSSMT